ncbi:MAG: sensor histidine kinase [Chlorobi bacterium]|nr:sensor histidine kinase [Chlorobiota bacterium]
MRVYEKTAWYLAILLLLTVTPLFSQDSLVVLKNKLSSTPPGKKYEIYLLLADAEPDSSKCSEYIDKSIESAKLNGSGDVLAHVYLGAVRIAFKNARYERALKYCKSAIAVANKAGNMEVAAEAYNYYGWIYAKRNMNEEAIAYFLKSVSVYEKLGQAEKTGDLFNSIGASYWRQNDYIKSIEYFERAIQVGEDFGNILLQIKACNNMGIIYENLTRYDKAMECQLQALELSQGNRYTEQRASTYLNIGNIYFYLKQYDEAINSYLKSLDIYKSIRDEDGQSLCNNNLGECYLRKGNIDEAISFYNKAYDYAQSKKDTLNMSLVLLNIGNANRLAGRLNKAETILKRSLEYSSRYSDKRITSETLLYLGETTASLKKAEEAEKYYMQALNYALLIKDKQLQLKIYNALAKFYYSQGNYKDAYYYKDKYAVLSDTLNNNKMIENMAKMNAIYQKYKDQATILNLQKENISHNKLLMQEKNKRMLFFIVSISFLIIIIVLLILFLYRRKMAIELRHKNEELNNLNATKDKFFSIIAHDLKSPFNSLMGFSEMLSLHAESKNIDQVMEYSNIIHNSTKKLFNLVENLLQWSRAQLGTTKYNPEQSDIYLLSYNIISLLRLSAEEKDIVISSRMSRDLIGWVDENLFNTVLRNLLSNAIKFSRVGSMIQVTAVREGDMIKISVSDSGVGIRRENLEKLFDIGTNISTKGTFNEKGTGLGLMLCKEFVEINRGTIWAESEYGNGSTFYFTVPVYNETKHKRK